jgi:hypothetical protein
MCAVSAVHNFASELPDDWWNSVTYQKYLELVEKAAAFDALVGQKECAVTEEQKQEFLARLDGIVNKGTPK